MAEKKLTKRERTRLKDLGYLDENGNPDLGAIEGASDRVKRNIAEYGLIELGDEGEITGAGSASGGSVEDLLREALDLTRQQYEENKDAIDEMIETGTADLKTAGAKADFANALEVINLIRAQRQMPRVKPEQFVGGYESEAALAEADPEAIAAQRRALHELGGRITPTMTAAERAMMEINRRAQEQELRAAREAALSSARARGFGGAGAEVQTTLGAGQGAAERRALQDLAAQAQAVGRSERALRDYGGLAGDIRASSFGEEFKRGTAADDAERFNRKLRQDYDVYKTRTLAQENRDRWGRQMDVSGATFGAISDRYAHETAPTYFGERMTGQRTGTASQGAAQTASALGALAGSKQAQEAAEGLMVKEDDGMFGLGVLGL